MRVPSTAERFVTCLLLSLGLGAGCAARTKPSEIVVLEILRQDKILSQPGQTAFALLAAADNFLLHAETEWDHGNDEDAVRDAVMGQIKMKTALAILEAERARARLAALNLESSEAETESAQLSDQAAMLKEQIGILERLRAEEKGIAAQKQALSMQSETTRRQTETERQKMTAQLAADKRHIEALEAIRAVDLLLKTAETVEASRYAKAKYLAAADMVQQAHKAFDGGDWDATITRTELAKAEAESSIVTARPVYEKAAQTLETQARDRALEAAATALPGIKATLGREGDRQSLVLVLRDLFAEGQSTVLPRAAPLLDRVGALLVTYSTYPLEVTGFTDNQGKPADLVALSLARANAVYWALVSRGVDPKRIIVDGKGPAEPVADNAVASGRAKNSRLEVSILYHALAP